ncbi:MAG: AI-2E family transporter [Ruminococcaceae bacterium]|nr:AI-2E family transporter [Oscillospiraceae bacterium]
MKDWLHGKNWYPYTVAACIAVTLYVALTHLSAIGGAVQTFLGYFSAIFLGCVLAYLMNPLAMLYQRLLFRTPRWEKLGWPLSIALTVLTLLLFLGFLLGTLIPQLVDSMMTLVNNMNGYISSLQALTVRLGIADTLKLDQLIGSSAELMNKLTKYLMDNINGILNASAVAGKSLVNWFVALILSVYLLASKASLKRFGTRLLRALLPKREASVVSFLTRCDKILVQYIVFSLLDAMIVGVANAVFMACLGMQYVGLVSMVVAVTNLIPTFGPVIGSVIGGFILLLVKPLHALIFIIFTLVLQFLDGYVIKPKLFGNSLGVSGLLILTAVIVCGNMFGIIGILLAIPLAAILDFVFEDGVLPALEKRAKGKAAETADTPREDQ